MTGRRISVGQWVPARLKDAPKTVATVAALAVVLVAAVLSALLAPGGGSGGTAAAAAPTAGGRNEQPAPPSTTAGAPGTTPAKAEKKPAKPKVAAVPDSIVHAAETPGRAVNITIDDGPDPTWTPKVLAVLRKHGVHATFCMIGPQAKAHPDLVKQIVAEGHRLCDHTVTHDESMDHKPLAYQEKEILSALTMIEQASDGAPVQYYRAPGGAFTPGSRALAAQHGMRPLGWNVDTKDYTRPGVPTILATVKSEISNGPTILFHDGGGNRSQTVAALDQTLSWLAAHHYAFSFPRVR